MDLSETFDIAIASERLLAIGYPLKTAEEMCERVTAVDASLAPQMDAVTEKIREVLDLVGEAFGVLSARMSAKEPPHPIADALRESLRTVQSPPS